MKDITLIACLYFSNNVGVSLARKKKFVPPLPGVYHHERSTKVILAQDIDYPPFTGIGEDLKLSGFGPDFARSLEEVCDIEVVLVQTDWSNCWGDNKIGLGLLNGYYHGCTTYTQTKGVRNRYLEFSAPILDINKPAGILTRLVGGNPVVDGLSDLSGVKVVDIVGWAPTSDVLSLSKNICTGEHFSGFNMVKSLEENPNDSGLKMLLDGEVDAIWIYADLAESYSTLCADEPMQDWDCDLWSKFGSDFAYVQTGMYDYMDAGTTLAISKKGSGLADVLDPCINAFIQTESYYNLCVEYNLEETCFQTEYFEKSQKGISYAMTPTKDLTTTCADGYCPCPLAYL